MVLGAIEQVNAGENVRIVEYSVQSNHLHMRLNRIWDRTGQGSVFEERFHMVVINTPSQMRNALNYVLRTTSIIA